MANQELDNFRKKYPQYDNIEDKILVDKLTEKYPQYEYLKEGLTKDNKSLFQPWGMELNQEAEKKHPYLAETQKILKEGIVTPALHFLNQAGLNAPRALAKKEGYEYPEAETLPGQVLSKSAGVAGAIFSPITRGILGVAKGGGILKNTLMGGLKGGLIGGLYSPTEDASNLKTRGKNVLVGSVLGSLTGAGSAILNKIKKYPLGKTQAVKQGAKTYHNEEVAEYGKMLDSLTAEKQRIDPTPVIDSMEIHLKENGVMTPEGKILQVSDKVDRALIKEYNLLYSKYVNGEVTTGDVITSIRNIKNSGLSSEPTALGRKALEIQGKLLQSIKPQIKSDLFDKANARYTEFKNNMDLLDSKFDIWGNPLKTEKGERYLTKALGRSGEARKVAEIIEKNLGQTLKGAKAISTANRLVSNPLVRWGALGLGGASGFRLLNRNNKR